jgi:cytochrome c oxidase assembly factor CtaG
LADQQMAGLLMWIPASVLFMLIGLGLFSAWMGEQHRRAGWASGTTFEGTSARAARFAAQENPHS